MAMFELFVHLGQMLGSKGKWSPNMNLPVCSVAMTVEKWYNKYIIDLEFKLNIFRENITINGESQCLLSPCLPLNNVLVCGVLLARLQIEFANYLRAKEK